MCLLGVSFQKIKPLSRGMRKGELKGKGVNVLCFSVGCQAIVFFSSFICLALTSSGTFLPRVRRDLESLSPQKPFIYIYKYLPFFLPSIHPFLSGEGREDASFQNPKGGSVTGCRGEGRTGNGEGKRD